ncbi:hypothetical protein [Niallia sp. Krafla_26]|uniref:hypothetical protein n=1 Tax=Niallia sp. Krafla_26 TaxID=3064703 RepID=UPI003D16725A
MKKGFHWLMILLVVSLFSLTPFFADNSSHPQTDTQHPIITFDWDSGTQTGDNTDKKESIVPGTSAFGDMETAMIILLLLVQCAAYLPQLRRRLFIETTFNQSNYVSHFY